MVTCKLISAMILCMGNFTYQEIQCVSINDYDVCTDINKVDDSCSQDIMNMTFKGIKISQAVKLIENQCVIPEG